MGLDLYFNRQAAVDAGLTMFVERNGTDEELARAKMDEEAAGYIAWLASEGEVIQVPGTELHVNNSGIEDNICIRANKWGRVYRPMTQWLLANNIEWKEF